MLRVIQKFISRMCVSSEYSSNLIDTRKRVCEATLRVSYIWVYTQNFHTSQKCGQYLCRQYLRGQYLEGQYLKHLRFALFCRQYLKHLRFALFWVLQICLQFCFWYPTFFPIFVINFLNFFLVPPDFFS